MSVSCSRHILFRSNHLVAQALFTMDDGADVYGRPFILDHCCLIVFALTAIEAYMNEHAREP